MLNYFEEKKETFFDLKNMNFSNSSKSHFFKGINPHFQPKNAIFFLYLDLIKIRLEIILSDFAQKKETFFGLKKQNFWKSKKSHTSKGLTHAFDQKMPFSSLLRFGQNKTKKKVNYFKEKKETLFDCNKKNFSKSKKSHFFQRG